MIVLKGWLHAGSLLAGGMGCCTLPEQEFTVDGPQGEASVLTFVCTLPFRLGMPILSFLYKEIKKKKKDPAHFCIIPFQSSSTGHVWMPCVGHSKGTQLAFQIMPGAVITVQPEYWNLCCFGKHKQGFNPSLVRQFSHKTNLGFHCQTNEHFHTTCLAWNSLAS